MDYKPGDKIMVTIGTRVIETTIDNGGVQRLPYNSVYKYLLEKGLIDLNAMGINYSRGKIAFEDYLDFYLNIGYSMCGFEELSFFHHLDITNPLWDKKE